MYSKCINFAIGILLSARGNKDKIKYCPIHSQILLVVQWNDMVGSSVLARIPKKVPVQLKFKFNPSLSSYPAHPNIFTPSVSSFCIFPSHFATYFVWNGPLKREQPRRFSATATPPSGGRRWRMYVLQGDSASRTSHLLRDVRLFVALGLPREPS